jgi:hypothetical protein
MLGRIKLGCYNLKYLRVLFMSQLQRHLFSLFPLFGAKQRIELEVRSFVETVVLGGGCATVLCLEHDK